MKRVLRLQPVTRIEGHASISIHLDQDGNVADARLLVTSLRGFEKFLQGRPAEEVPRIVTRICGICPWMHHLCACKAVEACFGVCPPPAGERLRRLCHLLAHAGDKILHFFFMASPDFLMGPDCDASARNILGVAERMPELASKAVKMRRLAQKMLETIAGRAIHPVASVVGGFSVPVTEQERVELLNGAGQLREFSVYALDQAKKHVFRDLDESMDSLGLVETGFIGMVDGHGNLRLYDGMLRLMNADGSIVQFSPSKYERYIAEHAVPWSYAKIPYAKAWGEGMSLDPDEPKGLYRANTLARINVADRFSTPMAQEALEEFRSRYGRPAQSTMLFHYARLIELIYVCEKAVELLSRRDMTDEQVCGAAKPRAGRGVGCVEAPRGTLIHDYVTDDRGMMVRANMIVGTTHNIGPMNVSVARAARALIRNGRYDGGVLNRIEMAVRAYDP